LNFKLDENLDPRLAPLIAEGDQDVDTVLEEGLVGSNDDIIFETCQKAARVLITLDLDFSNPLRFDFRSAEGVVVVRPPRPTLPMIRATLVSVLPELRKMPLRGKLHIVEPGRIRVYDPNE